MDLKKLHWVAGFLEGEGCFHVGGRTSMAAAQVQIEPLEKVQRILGGTINGPYSTKNPKRKPFFSWRLNGVPAIAAMLTLFSLLSPKRKAAITRAVQEWKAAPGNPKSWLARGTCNNGHDLTGANYIVAPSGHGRCRQCGIEGRRRYYAKNKDKWREYSRAARLRQKEGV